MLDLSLDVPFAVYTRLGCGAVPRSLAACSPSRIASNHPDSATRHMPQNDKMTKRQSTRLHLASDPSWIHLYCAIELTQTSTEDSSFDYMCMYVYINKYAYMYKYTHTYVCVYLYIYVYLFTNTHIQTYIHTDIHTYIHTYIRTHLYMYMYMYMYIYVYVYVYNSNVCI